MADPTIFTFTLADFKITDTRSRHKDTDYVSFTLQVKPATGTPTTKTLTKSMGDLNNGTFKVNLTFGGVVLNASDTVTLNYLIVNSGHKNESQIYSTLEDAGASLANKGLTAGGTAIGSAIGTLIPIPLAGTAIGAAIGAGAGWLVGELKGLLSADCDGLVAAAQIVMNYNDMVAKTAKGTFSETTKHPGSNSAKGCGSNSMYYVTWFMQSH